MIDVTSTVYVFSTITLTMIIVGVYFAIFYMMFYALGYGFRAFANMLFKAIK